MVFDTGALEDGASLKSDSLSNDASGSDDYIRSNDGRRVDLSGLHEKHKRAVSRKIVEGRARGQKRESVTHRIH